MKNRASIHTFILTTCLFIFGCGGPNSAGNKAEIERVIEQASTIQKVQDQSQQNDEQEILQFIHEIRKIDVSRCPGDFRRCWYAYTKVYSDMATLVRSSSSKDKTTLSREFERIMHALEVTSTELTAVARKHGAQNANKI